MHGGGGNGNGNGNGDSGSRLGIGSGMGGQEQQSTIRVVSFIHAYGRDLKEAFEWVKQYQRTKQRVDINQAWDLYSNVFRRIKKQINNVDKLELQVRSWFLVV